MCGIFLATCSCDINLSEIIRRGPDCHEKIFIKNQISVFSSVLHQQGFHIHRQPFQYNNSILLWNGENYQNKCENDGLTLLNKISNLPELELLHEFCKVKGPYATVFIRNDYLYFGRDVLGRRSLLCGIDNANKITIISSTIVDGCEHVVKWIEVPAIGMFRISSLEDFTVENLQLFSYDFHSCQVRIELEKLNWNGIVVYSSCLATNYCPRDFSSSVSSIYDDNFSDLLRDLLAVLERSVHKRVNHIHSQCSDCIFRFGFNSADQSCDHSKVAVLFSGGIDSAVVAVLTDKFVPINESIDLLNVSFSTGNKTHSESPDRVSGLRCLNELELINPSRRWNFVEIDIGPEELRTEREKRIAKLIQPCDSVLDDSIGCALWFAARGKGVIKGENTEYNSPARVVLTGIGADELMAGYSRHRCVFDRQGYEFLQKELDKELRQISSRNMGRDDRVISSHGKEGRFPFLDDEVVSFLMSLPINLKCDLTKERGLGEKMILRFLARDLLKLTISWANHKRAIQFGSHIAKVDRLEKGEKASQKCSRLLIN